MVINVLWIRLGASNRYCITYHSVMAKEKQNYHGAGGIELTNSIPSPVALPPVLDAQSVMLFPSEFPVIPIQ